MADDKPGCVQTETGFVIIRHGCVQTETGFAIKPVESLVASVDAYGKVVCYADLIAEIIKHGSAKNERPCGVQILTRSN